MRFRTIDIQNFLIIKKGNFSFENRGLVLINGDNRDAAQFDSNGSGKTAAIVDSLLWALWGKTSKGIAADDIVRSGAKNCSVCIELEDEDTGDEFIIGRYRKHKRFKNTVKLFVNNQDVTGASAADTQERIDEILGIDFGTFLSSIMFAQRSVKRFSAMTDREQKEALETILSLEWLNDAYQRVGAQLSTSREDLITAKEQAEIHQEELANKQEQLDDLLAEEEAFEDRKQNRISFLQSQRKSVVGSMGTLRAGLCDHTKEIQQAKDALKILRKTLAKPHPDEARLEREVQDLVTETTLAYRQFQQAVENQQSAKRLREGDCPHCGQVIVGSYIDVHVADLKRRARALREEYTHVQAELDDRKLALKEIRELDHAAKAKVQKEELGLTDKVRRLEFEELQNGPKLQEINKLQRQRNQFDAAILTAEAEVNKFTELADAVQQDIEDTEVDLAEWRRREKRLERVIEYLEFWREGFSARGIRSLVLDSIAEFLNQRVAEYSDILTGGAIDVELSTLTTLKSGEVKDSFSVIARNQSGAQRYGANSEGERRRIDLCVAFALGDLIATRSQKAFNILVLDEVFTHLDASGVDMVMLLLSQLVQKKESIFVITHHEDLKSRFTNIMTVVREDGSAIIR